MAKKGWARAIAGEGGGTPTSYVPSVESFSPDFRAGAAPRLPGDGSASGEATPPVTDRRDQLL